MSTNSLQHTHALAAIVSVSLAFLVVAGDVAVRYFGAEARALVTATDVVNLGGQVADLKTAVKDLTNKIGEVPRPGDFAALASRVDRQDALIAEIKQETDVTRADVNNIMRPWGYRNPKN